MNWRSLGLYLVVPAACLLPPDRAHGQPAKAEDLAARVQQLERRVAELEQAVKALPARTKEPPPTEVEKKLVGNWAVADGDRKVDGVCTDLRLRADGTGKAVFNRPDGHWDAVRYDLVGKELQLREQRGTAAFLLNVRLLSVTDAELVLEYLVGGKIQQVRYAREK